MTRPTSKTLETLHRALTCPPQQRGGIGFALGAVLRHWILFTLVRRPLLHPQRGYSSHRKLLWERLECVGCGSRQIAVPPTSDVCRAACLVLLMEFVGDVKRCSTKRMEVDGQMVRNRA